MGSRFTTVLWDVDDTLLDFAYSQRHALEKCFHLAGMEVTETQLRRYAEINDAWWKRLELGEVTKEQLLTGRFVMFFQEFGIEGIDVEMFRQEYQAALGSVFSFLDDSLIICRKLRGKVKQYVITNGVSSTQRSKLNLSGLADSMDGIFVSEEIGCPKPDIRFFEHCLKHVGEKDREKILVVGDSLTSDIKGGIGAGLHTCWYRRGRNLSPDTLWKPDYEIDDLHEIYSIMCGGAQNMPECPVRSEDGS